MTMDFFQIRDIIHNTLKESASSGEDGKYRVTVPAADALQANEVASDRFRGEYEMEGSNVFVFNDSETATEFSDQLDMNGLESYMESVNEKKLVKKKDDPCWDGYVQAGTKTKDGKEVPNCVPMDEALEEAKRLRKEDELEKDDDDPCWDGYVQLGTKKKNGKEVPNCVPMDEALQEAQKKYGVQSLGEKKKNVDQLKVGDSILMGSEDTPYKIVSMKKKDSDGPGTYYDAEVEGPNGKKNTVLSGQQKINEKKSGDDDAYKKFFNKSLDKFGVNSPAELSKEKKKEFFDYVDKNWKADNEETVKEARRNSTRDADIAYDEKGPMTGNFYMQIDDEPYKENGKTKIFGSQKEVQDFSDEMMKNDPSLKGRINYRPMK